MTNRGIPFNLTYQNSNTSIRFLRLNSDLIPIETFSTEVDYLHLNAGFESNLDGTYWINANSLFYPPGGGVNRNFTVAKLDENLAELNSIILGGDVSQEGDTVDQTGMQCFDLIPDTDMLYAGSTYNFFAPFIGGLPTWVQLYKLDDQLNVIWRKLYGGNASYYLFQISATANGGAFMTGSKYDYLQYPDSQDVDGFSILVDENGFISSLDESSTLKTVELLIGPNPCSNSLIINTDLKTYDVQIYDLNGKVLSSKSDLNGKSTLDMSSYPSGVCIIHVTSKDMGFSYAERVLKE